MAIYGAVPPRPALDTSPPTNPPLMSESLPAAAEVDIETWVVSSLESLTVAPGARGIGIPLAIPIDRPLATPPARRPDLALPLPGPAPGRIRQPAAALPRRDSQRRREALLKGKEGSRQRRRWDNDHLVGVPNAQPPQPTDWEVHPTHPVHRVPYQLAQIWDLGLCRRVQDRAAQTEEDKRGKQPFAPPGFGRVPRDLRETAKRSPVVRHWVRILEEPVRNYVAGEEDSPSVAAEAMGPLQQQARPEQALIRPEETDAAAHPMDCSDDDEEQILFAGRHQAMLQLREKSEALCKPHRAPTPQPPDSGIVFDSFGNGEGAAFKWVLLLPLILFAGQGLRAR